MLFEETKTFLESLNKEIKQTCVSFCFLAFYEKKFPHSVEYTLKHTSHNEPAFRCPKAVETEQGIFVPKGLFLTTTDVNPKKALH